MSTDSEVRPYTTNGVKNTKEKTVRPKRSLPSLQAGNNADDMRDISYQGKVESAPTNFGDLPLYAIFSLSPDGSYPQIKVAKSKYADIRTGKSAWAGSGKAYRVII